MSQSTEIIAKIGADTSDFRRGVDTVRTQTAAMNANMRIAFATGEQGARNLRVAFKGVADIAGQSAGPLGQMLAGIKDIFQTFQANPMLGAATAISGAISMIAKDIERAADSALTKTKESVEGLKRTQSILKILFPEIYGKGSVAELQKEVSAKAKAGDLGGLQRIQEREDAAARIAKEEGKVILKRETDAPSELAATRARLQELDKRAATFQRHSPNSAIPGDILAERTMLRGRQARLEDELAKLPEKAKDLERRSPIVMNRADIARSAVQDEMDRREKQSIDMRAKQQKDAQDSARRASEADDKLKTARRDYMIERAKAIDAGPVKAINITQEQRARAAFISEDLATVRRQREVPSMRADAALMTRQLELMTQQLKLLRDVRENTGKPGATM